MTTYSTLWRDKDNVVRDLHDKRMPNGLGTSGLVPRMNLAGTAMEWSTIATSSDVVDVKVDGTSVLDANKIALIDLGDFGISATSNEINVLDGITATTTELNYTDGVTSNIQTQLNNKQATITSTNKLNADLLSEGTTNKLVSQSDKTNWNNKLDKNNTITAATKTKITYDAKGLVTAGADLSSSDIPSLDASKITSGTFADARIASATTWNGKEDASNKTTTLTSGSTNTQYPGAKVVYDTIEDVREIAAGKNANIVANITANPSLNSLAATVTVSSITDIDGNSHAASTLKKGDNIYITDVDVPDRWVGTEGSTVTLYKLETAKVPVTDVKKNNVSVVTNSVANIPNNLSDYADDATHRLVTDTEKTTWNNKYDSSNPAGYTSNIGTITGITMNGSSKGTSGVVDLGTVITDVSGKEDTSNKSDSYTTSSSTTYASTKALVDGLATKQPTISDLTTIRNGATAGATAVQPAAISDMATLTWTTQQISNAVSDKETKGYITFGSTTYELELTETDPGAPVAGKFVFVVESV